MAGTFLRHQLKQKICNPNSMNSSIIQTSQLVLPQIRFEGTDTKANVVVDCSGTSCEPIKRGMVCAPGTEEYCIAGHMPGQEEDVMVGDHSTVTPGQYSRTFSKIEPKGDKQEAKADKET